MTVINKSIKVTVLILTENSYYAQNGVNGVYLDQNSSFLKFLLICS